MSKIVNLDLDIHCVTRVEGHGDILVKVEDGKVKNIQWEVSEAPRFFEAMVVGRKWNELALITSRICGICSIGHTLASLKATEDAFGITPSQQTIDLRDLLLQAENIQSHVLHVGYLVLPDLLGVGSVLPLASTHKEALLTVVALHRLSNEMCDLIGGRTTHPVTTQVNGFSRLPTLKELEGLREKIKKGKEQMQVIVGLVSTLASKVPDFERETEYIALKKEKEYALYDGLIASTDVRKTFPVSSYEKVTNEYVVPQSTAKWTKHKRDSYMVGALARYNLNHQELSENAKKAAECLKLKAICYNPFMNSIAQVVEVVYSLDRSLTLVEKLLGKGLKKEENTVKVKEGRGIGAAEVPRGILFHDYIYDKNGVCKKANCIIPTNQNHANIQLDMESLVPRMLDREEKEIELTLEMLVRAYDPCISCSTHTLKVKVEKK